MSRFHVLALSMLAAMVLGATSRVPVSDKTSAWAIKALRGWPELSPWRVGN